MREGSTDRRSQRSRQLLIEALADLMHTKRYSSISVQEISDRANVGRSTFYAHFQDKDDLLVQGVRQMVGSLEHSAPGPRNTLAPSLGLFRHLAAGRDLNVSMAHGRHLSLFFDALQTELAATFAERMTARLPPTATTVPVPLLAAMVAGMLITAARSWLESGPITSAEAANRSFTIAAEAALRAGLRPVAQQPATS
jgi:AcrR family transcriptional regulator